MATFLHLNSREIILEFLCIYCVMGSVFVELMVVVLLCKWGHGYYIMGSIFFVPMVVVILCKWGRNYYVMGSVFVVPMVVVLMCKWGHSYCVMVAQHPYLSRFFLTSWSKDCS
jgi:hypothetical protein